MYLPAHFRASDEEAAAIVERHAFGMLVSAADGVPRITHLPMILERTADGLVLLGHVARANPHWRELDGVEALAVFGGPHAHVSPTWYTDGPAVPTWNYVAAEARVRVRTVHEPEALQAILAPLVRRYESAWTFESQPEGYRRGKLRGIVGLRMTVLRLEGKIKMNQNRSAVDREGVVAGLRARGGAEDVLVADLVACPASSGSR